MAATGATLFPLKYITGAPTHHNISSTPRKFKLKPVSAHRSHISTKAPPSIHERSVEKDNGDEAIPRAFDESVIQKLSVKDYLERSKELIKPDGGPPRWFSPVEGGARWDNSPLLLYLPGLDGVGLGLILHHQRLGKMFDIWCLHIPVMDRTPFEDLLLLVERTVKSENSRSPSRPIYLVGESLGGCLALAIAARNPTIDLMLILANPATSFSKSQLQPLLPFLEAMLEPLHVGLPYILGFLTGDPFKMMMAAVENGFPLQQTTAELSQNLANLLPSLSVMADILPKESLLWKLQMLNVAAPFANSRIHAIKAETLILAR